MIDFNMTLRESILHPRIHHQLLPNKVSVEGRVASAITKSLEIRNHKVN